MTPPPSPVKQLGLDILAYLSKTGRGWWVIVAILFGFWDQLIRLLPETWSRGLKLGDDLLQAVVVVALLVGPFLAWRQQRKDFRRLESQWWRGFGQSRVEVFFRESSRMVPMDQFLELGAIFDARRDEIQRGDFSRAGEVFPVVEAYIPLLEKCVPHGSVAYPNRVAEIKEVYKQVEEYMVRISKD